MKEKNRIIWRLGIENEKSYLAIFCGFFTLYFCRCGSCFLPLLLWHNKKRKRTCGFCSRKFTYDNAPEGSVAYQNIFACGCCMRTEKTKDFRELVEAE